MICKVRSLKLEIKLLSFLEQSITQHIEVCIDFESDLVEGTESGVIQLE
jgi:hypothetical protein